MNVIPPYFQEPGDPRLNNEKLIYNTFTLSSDGSVCVNIAPVFRLMCVCANIKERQVGSKTSLKMYEEKKQFKNVCGLLKAVFLTV